MATKYYRKEIASNKLYLKATGAPVKWELIGGDEGIFATDNDVFIAELAQAIARGVGGVVSITEAEYNEQKKRASGPPLLNSLKDRFSLSGLSLPQVASAVAANPTPLHGQLSNVPRDIPKETPEPLKVETEFQRPKTGKGFFKERSDAK